MKVLIIAPPSIPLPTSGYGGTQRVCFNLLKGLQALNIQAALAGPKGSQSDQFDIIETPILPTRKSDAATLDAYIQSIKTQCPFNPDIIHNHSDAAVQINHYFPGTPLVTTIHGYHEDLPQIGHLIFISQSQQQDYAPTSPAISQIYNPIDVSEFTFQESKSDYLIFMAKLNWSVKGVDVAIRVAKKSKTSLYLCGPGMNWKLRLKMNRFISYKGEVGGSTKTALLGNAKALIYPTLCPESFGLAPAEANACGTPAIVLNNGAMREVIAHGKSGFVCDTEEELTKAVHAIHLINPNDCRNWVKSQFDHIKITQNHLELFHQLIDQKTSV